VSTRREATAADLPALVALDAEVFGADAWSEASWAEELAGATRHVEVVTDDAGAVLAYGVLMVVADVADLQRIAVAPGSRRSGLARGLLDAAVAEAQRRGARRLLLEVDVGNAAAAALYEAAGFVRLHRREGYYAAGGDALVLQLRW
jgi:ribosomal-protein-alanine N-acetyltransferase